MKKVLIIFLLIPIITIAQTKIDGVGFFRIGKSKAQILDSLKAYLGEPIEYDGGDDSKFTSEHFYKEIDGSSDQGNWFYFCPSFERYDIPLFTISSIDFHNVYLVFNGDSLVYFNSEWSREIENAVNVKYGNGKLVKSHFNSYNNKKVFTSYKITWKSSNDISCECGYSDGCVGEDNVCGYFIIGKKLIRDKINDCMAKYYKKRNIERKEKQKKELKDKLHDF